MDVEPEQHRYRYKMESTPLPVGNYVGEFRIESDAEHESSVVWAADFEVTKGDEAKTVGAVRQFLEIGARSIACGLWRFALQPRDGDHSLS